MNTGTETNKEVDFHARSLLEELLQSARRAIRAGRAFDQVSASKGAYEQHWAAAEAAVEAVIEARDKGAAWAQVEENAKGIKNSPEFPLIEEELAKLNATLREHFGARTKVSFEPDWGHGYKHEFYWDALKPKARAAVTAAARRFSPHTGLDVSACCRGMSSALEFVCGLNEQLEEVIGEKTANDAA